RAGPVVDYGLLLDRVDVPCDDLAVVEQVELASYDAPDAAEPHLALAYLAAPCARGALDPPVRQVAEELRLFPRCLCKRPEPWHFLQRANGSPPFIFSRSGRVKLQG